MEKTKLGITVSLLGTILAFFGLAGGYIITGIAVGYVLVKEENVWLKKFAVKVLLAMAVFTLANSLLGIFPNVRGILNGIVGIFGDYISMRFLDNILSILLNILEILKLFVFGGLAVISLKQIDFKIPVLDEIIEKHM